MGSNGTVEERLAEAEAARAVLGAAWRENLRWPDRAHRQGCRHLRAVAVAFIRRHRPRVGRRAVLVRSPSRITSRRASVLTEAVFSSGLRRYDGGRRGLEARVDLLLLHQRPAAPSFVVDVSRPLRHEARARSTATSSQFAPPAPRRRRHATDIAAVPSADREPRRAVRRARRRAFAEGLVVREPIVRANLLHERRAYERRHRLLRVGRRQRHRRDRAGQGARGARPSGPPHQHRYAVPARRASSRAGRSIRCDTPSYPLFREPQYLLSLANTDRAGRARRAARHHPRALRDSARHGRVPRAQVLASTAGTAVPQVVTTLHGTDITLRRQRSVVLARSSRSRSSSPTA